MTEEIRYVILIVIAAASVWRIGFLYTALIAFGLYLNSYFPDTALLITFVFSFLLWREKNRYQALALSIKKSPRSKDYEGHYTVIMSAKVVENA